MEADETEHSENRRRGDRKSRRRWRRFIIRPTPSQRQDGAASSPLPIDWPRAHYFLSVCLALVGLTFIMIGGFAQSDPQQQVGTDQVMSSSSESIKPATIDVLSPPQLRPKFHVNVRDWTRRLSEEIRAVNNKTSCLYNIERFFDKKAEYQALDPIKALDNILSQIQTLLSQHRAAVGAIVNEAEKLATAHNFTNSTDCKVNYTDVHRIKSESDNTTQANQQQQQPQPAGDSTGGGGQMSPAPDQIGTTSGNQGAGQGAQFTSISGGTPVPGPPECQPPFKNVSMQVNKNFGDIPVNTSMSAIHLPLHIYAGQLEIMNGVDWTEKLDAVFKRNLVQYMHVHHQYYGDKSGFLRTFPAHRWRIPRTDPDLFDARTRPWYVAGASSSKDVVILVDSSGSMTGLRREIARGVVFEILDTLTSNDYFSVMRFSETVTPIGFPKCNLRTPKLAPAIEAQCQMLTEQQTIECQNYRRQLEQKEKYLIDHPNVMLDKNGSYLTDEIYRKTIVNITHEIEDAYMLPATSRNIRYLKSNFSMPTAGIANFTHALMSAFELLQAYNRTSDQGAKCNRAIFLITDGAIKSHDDIFNRYNYPNSPTRVFTYMIGREVGDITHTKAMACSNRGYYTHVINLGEVREKVLKYLPVMARPLVLERQHPIVWTYAYGDETYQVLTDWVLETKRRERARIMLNELNATSSNDIPIELVNISEYDDLPQVDEELKHVNRSICEDSNDDPVAIDEMLQVELDPLGYNDLPCHWSSRRADLLTSVVKPVFDHRNFSWLLERVWDKNKNTWTKQMIRVRDAPLVGVAAVDLRIADIIKVAPSHLLGPNGYAILMGNNGFVMHHPDLRALLEDPFDKQSKILKPYFNAVDLTHIEQGRSSHNYSDAEMNERVFNLRDFAVKGRKGKGYVINVKRAVDCRKRVHISQQVFYYGPVEDTPFSFMISLPKSYGVNRLQAKLELKQFNPSFLKPSAYDLWTVHPEYRYCESSNPKSNTSVATILEIIEQLGNPDRSLANVLYDDLTAVNNLAGTGFGTTPSSGQTHRQSSSPGAAAASASRIICDKDLFPSLLFDAASTYEQPDTVCGFSSSPDCEQPSTVYGSGGQQQGDSCAKTADEMRSKLASIYGLEMSFLATRSGLTRVRVFDLSQRIKKLADIFIQRHNKAVDEAWYSRTVAWNLRVQKDATIISAPYNAYARLVAKLRQRITQRMPAPGDSSRTICDEESTAVASPPSLSSSSGEANLDSTDSAALDSAWSSSSPPSGPDSVAAPEIQNDEPPSSAPDGDQGGAATEGGDSAAGANESPSISRINYSEYSSFDFLDLLYNSSVHISATQSVLANQADSKRSSPVAVSGLLYDYATFARRFLNSTSLSIRNLESSPNGDHDENSASQSHNQANSLVKVDICPGGECPTKCGYRNDTIDCLLVDNNGFVVVGEELPYIGRPLTDYDENLMKILLDRRLFHVVELTDYQAICTRNDQIDLNPAAAARGAQISSPSNQLKPPSVLKLQVAGNIAWALMLNFASIGAWIWTSIYSLLFVQATYSDVLGQLMQLQRSPEIIGQADAQSAAANQSMLALLPNKTYLRPCEKTVELYELDPSKAPGIESPEYFVTKCGCSGWYVYDLVPKTNLIMLIVNTTSACRKCNSSGSNSNFVPVVPQVELSQTATQQLQMQQAAALGAALAANKTAEDQVCAMLERDSRLYVKRQTTTCYSFHPEEAEVHICGGAQSSARVPLELLLLSLISLLLPLGDASRQTLGATGTKSNYDEASKDKRSEPAKSDHNDNRQRWPASG